MNKKIIFILSLVIILGILCCSALLHSLPSNKKTIIQFSSWGSESEIKILKPILEDFEKENPDIHVEFLHIPQNYFQKIHLLFASNTAPDVLFINNQYLPIYANAGVLEDLTPYSEILELDKFYQKSIQTLTWKGKIYAVPRDISNLVIFYNKDIFNKYNVPYPQKGWTFDEFLKTSQKLTHLPDVFGISFEDEPLFYLPYLMSSGADNFENFEDNKLQNGLKFYADLRTKHHTAPRKEEAASATMAQMFLQGRLGMHLSGRWLVPKYRQEAKFDWDVVEFPKGETGSIIPMDASGWAVSKSSKHKKEALKLIKYLSSKKNSDKFTSSGLIVPARIDSANSKVFLDGKKPHNAKVFLSVIETSKPTPVTINFREVLDNLKNKTEYMFNKQN